MMRFCSNFRFKNVSKVWFPHTEVLSWNTECARIYPNYVKSFRLEHEFQIQSNSVTVFCVLFSFDYLEGLGVE